MLLYYSINYLRVLFKVVDPALSLERDVFLYRSYLALKKFRVVLDEISPSSPELVQPLKMLANFLAYPAKRDDIVADLDSKVHGDL